MPISSRLRWRSLRLLLKLCRTEKNFYCLETVAARRTQSTSQPNWSAGINGSAAGLPALALSDNLSSVTAIGNDYGFDSIFSRQVEAFGTAGDIAIGISTSGDSENILRALKTARERRMTTVGMTGRRGGRLKTSVDYCLAVPSDETPRVQECHILLGHIICDLVERSLFHE